MKNLYWAGGTVLALFASFSILNADEIKKIEKDLTPKADPDQAGYYLDHEQAKAMGGIGNYVTAAEVEKYKSIHEEAGMASQAATKDLTSDVEKANSNLHFATDDSDLNYKAVSDLDSFGKVLASDSSKKVEVSGFTDSVGSSTYNKGLSMDRADAVQAKLMDEGVSKDQVVVKANGDLNPIASNDNADGRAKNRRVEIKLIG